jgi:HlyD family secretion protein
MWMRRKGWLIVGAGTIVALLTLIGARFAGSEPKIPTTEVVRGPFQDVLELRGEVKAQRSIALTAPMRAGNLLIVRLTENGVRVRKGDVVVEFDASRLKQQLAEDQSALETALAQIQQSEAQGRLTDQQDVTGVMTSRYTLQAAKLDASKQEILSKIDGEEAQIKVTDSDLALKQADEKLAMDRAAAATDLTDQKEKRDKARFDVKRDENTLAQMTLRAPIDGTVTILSHWSPEGPQNYRQGDQVWSGAAIAELPDLSTIYFDARADETDRSRLKVGQTGVIRVDAIPGADFSSVVRQISTLASIDFSATWPFPRNFEVRIGLTRNTSQLRPGMSATARITVGRVPDAIQIPTRAVFQKNGQTVAYVLKGSKFEPRTIQIAQRGEGMQVVTGGLKPGELVALGDPTAKE